MRIEPGGGRLDPVVLGDVEQLTGQFRRLPQPFPGIPAQDERHHTSGTRWPSSSNSAASSSSSKSLMPGHSLSPFDMAILLTTLACGFPHVPEVAPLAGLVGV